MIFGYSTALHSYTEKVQTCQNHAQLPVNPVKSRNPITGKCAHFAQDNVSALFNKISKCNKIIQNPVIP